MKPRFVYAIFLYMVSAIMIGCQSNKVSRYNFPAKYDILIKIEKEVFQNGSRTDGEQHEMCEDMPPVPDYFDFGRAVMAYENGRIAASRLTPLPFSDSLSVFAETNLVDQAFRDGFDEQRVRNPAAILERNRIRKQRQLEFFGLFQNDGDTETDGIHKDTHITTNCYVQLMSSYVKGYQNGYRVVMKLGRPHVPTFYYTGFTANLGADAMKRAYVYGWYSAYYDYFCDNSNLYYAQKVQIGRPPDSFYAHCISEFKWAEDEFLIECAKKKDVVKIGGGNAK